jgi:hypothetical protein
MNGILIGKRREREGMFFADYGGLMEDLSLREMWGLLISDAYSGVVSTTSLASDSYRGGNCKADSVYFLENLQISSISLANLLDFITPKSGNAM